MGCGSAKSAIFRMVFQPIMHGLKNQAKSLTTSQVKNSHQQHATPSITYNPIRGGNSERTELVQPHTSSPKGRLSLCISAMAAVLLCVLSLACSPDDEPIEQDKPLAAPTDSLTHPGGGGFEFDTDDDPSISIPLNPTQKNQ